MNKQNSTGFSFLRKDQDFNFLGKLLAMRIILRDGFSPLSGALLGVWVLLMLAIPIVGWTLGEVAQKSLIPWSVVAQVSVVFAILVQSWGWRETIRVAAIVAVFTFGMEWLGSSTGFPFGPYEYTPLLQPQLAHVPLLIPFAWLMMLPSTWSIAQSFNFNNKWLYALIAGAALTAWDFLLDPQMVAWGLWVWDNPIGFFGIPWTNFGGWLLTGVSLTLLIRPRKLPLMPLLVVYTITWFLESFGLTLFWGLPGPGIVGGLIMGVFMVLGWRNLHRASES